MKNLLKYILFTVAVFILLLLCDLLSGAEMNLGSNAIHSLQTTLIFWVYNFYQKSQKDAR